MDKVITKNMISAFSEYAKENPNRIRGITCWKEGDNELIRIDTKCKYIDNSLPVYLDIADKSVKISFSFYFTIPYLTLYDEYELTKALNKGIDYFTTFLIVEDKKTKVDMGYAIPCCNRQDDMAPIMIHLLENLNFIIERFLSIYNQYCDNAMWDNYEKQSKNIVILSQYRKSHNKQDP